MIRIGILSDTHGYLPAWVTDFFSEVDEIWHAGDMGDLHIPDQLSSLKPLRAVYGNIDGQEIRKEFPKDLLFFCEEVKVLITHIGGYPGRYDPRVRSIIELERPKLVVCGHSHILKVIYDQKWKHLHINPGAAGKYGLHHSITAIRLIIEGNNMRDMEVLDIPR